MEYLSIKLLADMDSITTNELLKMKKLIAQEPFLYSQLFYIRLCLL